MNLLTGFKSFLSSWKVEEGCGWTVAQQVVGAMQKGRMPTPAGCLLIDTFRQYSAEAGSFSPISTEEFREAFGKLAKSNASVGGKNATASRGHLGPTSSGYTEVEWTYMSKMQGPDGGPMLRKRPGRVMFDMGPQGYTEVEWTYLKSGKIGLTGQSIRDVAQSMATNSKG